MRFYFGSNLKMNQSPREACDYVAQIESWLVQSPAVRSEVQLWAAVSFINLEAAARARPHSRLWIGAQNVHWADEGAFTGEVSAKQLKACGADFVLLGHAERRTLFGETDEQIGLKARACARHKLRIILCVGEPSQVYEAGAGAGYVDRQLEQCLARIETPVELSILYEPIWSIGEKGRPAELGYVDQSLSHIRSFLGRRFPAGGGDVPVMYGGSVTAANAGDYAALPHCAGLGVGRAAWAAPDFVTVLRQCLARKHGADGLPSLGFPAGAAHW